MEASDVVCFRHEGQTCDVLVGLIEVLFALIYHFEARHEVLINQITVWNHWLHDRLISTDLLKQSTGNYEKAVLIFFVSSSFKRNQSVPSFLEIERERVDEDFLFFIFFVLRL